MPEPILQVQDLKTYFPTKRGIAKAVDGVSFSLEAGKVLALVGESGCGKSVTGLSIMRLLAKNAVSAGGQVLFRGADLLRLPEREMDGYRGSEISMIFQESIAALDPIMTVEAQMLEALRRLHPGAHKGDLRKRMLELLEQVHIRDCGEVAGSYPQQLSGGMCQRVMIAMAMCSNPRLLIADEPTTALDVTVQLQILALMDELKEKNDTAILLITHDMGVVAQMADQVAVMYCGRIVELADVEALFHRPRHPYTKALLRSVPAAGKEKLQAIEGVVPDLTRLPAGCSFCERCERRGPQCESQPELRQVEGRHLVSCFYPEETAEGRRAAV